MSEVLSPSVDVQASRPRTEVSLTRVGVRGIEKVITVNGAGASRSTGSGLRRTGAGDAAGNYFFAELECFVDLNPRQAGVHMSRFEEVVNAAIDEVVLGETLRAEELAAHIAGRVREQQEGLRAEVTIAARYPETVATPASGLRTQEIYTLCGTAVVSERGTRTLTGVEAQGMTACPCAQELVSGPLARAARRRRLHRRRDRARARRPFRWPPTTSAASARCTSAGRRASSSTSTPATSCTSSSSR